MRYRRTKIKGGTYFFTVVTFERKPVFAIDENVTLLRASFKHVMERRPFIMDAAVILPDHLHCIWTLPENDHDYSLRWRLIKTHFSKKCNELYKQNSNRSREEKRELTIWQRRFWEHWIRDDDDFARHVDYIHYNPVKHQLARTPKDWPYSSFHKYVKLGLLQEHWCVMRDIEDFGYE